jgi:hypothetical protein
VYRSRNPPGAPTLGASLPDAARDWAHLEVLAAGAGWRRHGGGGDGGGGDSIHEQTFRGGGVGGSGGRDGAHSVGSVGSSTQLPVEPSGSTPEHREPFAGGGWRGGSGEGAWEPDGDPDVLVATVGQYRLTLSNPTLNRQGISA